MAVDTKHSLYTLHSPNWKFMRDCIEGDSAIKAGGETYVPSLSGQDKKTYAAYIGRSYFEGYTQRVLDGLTGLMFSKSPLVKAPTQLEELFSNFDLNGSTLTDYVQELADETESVGRVGGLVDQSSDGSNNRPFATIYKTETIINWRHQNINGATTLTMTVLEEIEQNWIDDFEVEDITIYRGLFLIEGLYQQNIYRPVTDNSGKITSYTIDTIIPLMNGQPLSYIPFVSITPDKLTIVPQKPPLLDVARVNVAHFKLNTDYYHGMHFTALPTPWITGYQKPQGAASFNIGSSTILEFNQKDTKLGFLEFEGKGLETLENEKMKLIDSMVVLGSNMLQGDKSVAEAENTVAMRSAGQNASLVSTADTISRGVVKILEIMAEWGGWSGDIEYSLNTDYNATQMSPQLLKELIVGRTMGEIPRKVMFDTLLKGEMLPEDMTYDEFEEMLTAEAPIIATSALPAKVNNDIDIKAIAAKVGAN